MAYSIVKKPVMLGTKKQAKAVMVDFLNPKNLPQTKTLNGVRLV
jgi:hypothetical protein